jgi:phenylalanine-4-hydroxylase
VTIRDAGTLDYLPEPDIFHDIAGHVPMHADAVFARALVRLGDCAAAAARRSVEMKGELERLRRLTSNIRALSRFFWFSVEFGLVSEAGGLRAYGSGLLSSPGELVHAIEAADVQRFPFQLEWVVNQTFEIDRFQPILFAIESFDHLFEMVRELEDWLLFGRLDNVAAGEPNVREEDLRSFLSLSA